MSATRTMRLGAFLYATGHHIAAWRHPSAQADSGFDIDHYIRVAQSCERAGFDLLFLEDGSGVREADLNIASHSARAAHFEPVSLLAALAVQTSRIGLVGTVSTSYHEPYHVARTIASLDHLSGGRAGWNLVTSQSDLEAQNFGLTGQRLHADRYARAEEFVEVVQALWDSYDDDAIVEDCENARYYDEARLRRISHKGAHFSVRGPLNVIRTPQGHPVIVQAGASESGLTLASRSADVVFAAAQTLEEGQRYYRDLKRRVREAGRRPEDLLVMPGIFAVAGTSRAEAEERFEQLQELIDPEVGVRLLFQHLGVAVPANLALDEPLPANLLQTNGNRSRQQLLLDLAARERLTVRELYRKVAGARGHWQVVGTAQDIADQMQERFEHEAADGFNIMPPTLPGGLDDFIERVLPELQRRGLWRPQQGSTLRESLGLPRPARKSVSAA
ncbi:LLM class flavin-dependent oxidoreductase [Paraburkholderia sp. BCC1886]|uniref:LLM class flavin-dependent oxidoreductase n=1 Tax=Paraburkholderia sp. BCC1886 TaxID=2562670 RepID=UPI0011822926|nr:LLM class flavin-dependent oxidoreductase [Paraburkholderia sp. BCC1886]